MHLTNAPLNALVILNDTIYVEAARVMAKRVMKTHLDDRERLNYAYKLAFSRSAEKYEMDLLLNRLVLTKAKVANNDSGASKFINVGGFKRDAALDPVEHASWTVIYQLILNLDETLNKE